MLKTENLPIEKLVLRYSYCGRYCVVELVLSLVLTDLVNNLVQILLTNFGVN